MKIAKRGLSLPMFIVLSLLIIGKNNIQAETNFPPVAEAGPDITVSVNEIDTTIIMGTVTDPDNTGTLRCLWEDAISFAQVSPTMYVGPNGECPLELSHAGTYWDSGTYTLVIYAVDGTILRSD